MNQALNKNLQKKPSAPKKPLCELIEISSELQKKTKMVASLDVVVKKVENDGEKALAELSAQFDEWMVINTKPLIAINDDLKENPLNAERLAKVYEASHEIKGIALTLGYPLAGKIAFSLCNLIECLEVPNLIPISVIDQHVTSIQAIINNQVKNDGTSIARTLVARLSDVTLEYIDTITKKSKN